jgi:hypothetical protein
MNIPETLKMPSLSGLGKRPQGILRNQSIRGFFCFKFSFQNCFWNVFSTSGLSQICKIRNAWKLPSPFSWNTLIPCSEKTSWSLKTSFWKKKLSNKFKNGHKKFLPRKISWEKSLNFIVLAYLSKKSQNHGNPFALKIVMTVFKFDD